jgi:hypothetical protein
MDIRAIEAQRLMAARDWKGAGAVLAPVRAACPATRTKAGGWTEWCHTNKIRMGSARKAISAFSDPVAWEAKAEARRIRQRVTPGTALVLAPKGELHEATRGFKAMMVKAEAEEDIAKSEKRRVVAFQHFKFLLNASNLPALMQMPPDEIINLLRKI